jgi:hypothetical protein
VVVEVVSVVVKGGNGLAGNAKVFSSVVCVEVWLVLSTGVGAVVGARNSVSVGLDETG